MYIVATKEGFYRSLTEPKRSALSSDDFEFEVILGCFESFKKTSVYYCIENQWLLDHLKLN